MKIPEEKRLRTVGQLVEKTKFIVNGSQGTNRMLERGIGKIEEKKIKRLLDTVTYIL